MGSHNAWCILLAHFLLPTACKVRSSNNGCNSSLNCCQETSNYLKFMEGRMHNKRQIRCQIFIKVLNGKRRVSLLLQAVALMKRKHITVWQMAELCSSAMFLSLTSHQLSFFSYQPWWAHHRRWPSQLVAPLTRLSTFTLHTPSTTHANSGCRLERRVNFTPWNRKYLLFH